MVPEGTFPSDVIERAHKLIKANPGGSGAYSNSQGIPLVCKDVADFIGRRDGYPCDPTEIFLSNGASQSVQNSLMLLSNLPTDGFLVPIPQYPLYSATITLYGAKLVGYYLDEEKDWGLNMEELEERVKFAKENNITLKGMVIINPGNPTGMVGDSLLHSLIHSLVYYLTHSFIHSLSHSFLKLSYSLTHYLLKTHTPNPLNLPNPNK